MKILAIKQLTGRVLATASIAPFVLTLCLFHPAPSWALPATENETQSTPKVQSSIVSEGMLFQIVREFMGIDLARLQNDPALALQPEQQEALMALAERVAPDYAELFSQTRIDSERLSSLNQQVAQELKAGLNEAQWSFLADAGDQLLKDDGAKLQILKSYGEMAFQFLQSPAGQEMLKGVGSQMSDRSRSLLDLLLGVFSRKAQNMQLETP
jgi:hypothetical protein